MLILVLSLTACAPQAGGEAAPSATPTMAAVDVLLSASEPTAAPTPVPTAAPTPVPTPAPTAVPEWFGITDNGVDGVGTVRGNTNGNLAVGGDVVSDGETVYYFWDSVLIAYDIRTGTKTQLVSCVDGNGRWLDLAPDLNLYRGYVYFIADGIVQRIPAAGGEVEQVSDRESVVGLLAAYGSIFIVSPSAPTDSASTLSTFSLDAETLKEEAVLDDFIVSACMDGRLYGWTSVGDDPDKERRYLSVDPDGGHPRRFPVPEYPFPFYACLPCGGYLYVVDDMYRMGGVITEEYDFSGRVLKIDVETDETEVFPVPDIHCNGRECTNVTPDNIYIQRYGWDGNGDIWRMSTDGQRFSLFDKRTYHSGISLVGDVPAMDYIGDYDNRNNGNEADP